MTAFRSQIDSCHSITHKHEQRSFSDHLSGNPSSFSVPRLTYTQKYKADRKKQAHRDTPRIHIVHIPPSQPTNQRRMRTPRCTETVPTTTSTSTPSCNPKTLTSSVLNQYQKSSHLQGPQVPTPKPSSPTAPTACIKP